MNKILIDKISAADNQVDLYKAPYKKIKEFYTEPCADFKCRKDLHVAVVAAPCHGFGDVIFASKFANYIKKGLFSTNPYSSNVVLITSLPNLFKTLDNTEIPIIGLQGRKKQCRKLQHYKRPIGLETLDLIFIAPLNFDYNVEYVDVKGLFNESTPFNTIFVSEYQTGLRPGLEFDIPTGIGPDYFGLLFDDLAPSPKLSKVGKTPYILAYLAKDIGIHYCLSNFIKMSVKKYSKYSRLQIVLPKWSINIIQKNASLLKFLKEYYSNCIAIINNMVKDIYYSKDNRRFLTLRGDIFPVKRKDMLSLIKYSLPDVLLTGDQSVTDAIDCCSNKIIWYQMAPWKIAFAHKLSTEFKNPFLHSSTTSCGTLRALNWRPAQNDLKTQNDFRIKARHVLDAIFRAVSESKDPHSQIAKYLALLSKSKSKKILLQGI